MINFNNLFSRLSLRIVSSKLLLLTIRIYLQQLLQLRHRITWIHRISISNFIGIKARIVCLYIIQIGIDDSFSELFLIFKFNHFVVVVQYICLNMRMHFKVVLLKKLNVVVLLHTVNQLVIEFCQIQTLSFRCNRCYRIFLRIRV
jgi:hypothetical protein